jgi:hypothetical protein
MIMLFRRMGAALKRRQFGQMFYEFMLIFLAVMAGFAAENWRENLEDRKRLKEYLVSMGNDLRADQREAQRVITTNKVAQADILFVVEQLYGTPNDSQFVELYQKARYVNRKLSILVQRDQVYAQMKSAGDLRLIGNAALADSIAGYYFLKQQSDRQFVTLGNIIEALWETQHTVLDSRIFMKLTSEAYNTAALSAGIKRLKAPIVAQGLGAFTNTLQSLYGVSYVNNRHAQLRAENAHRLEALLTAELKRLE